ncbi:golgi apparatus membrane protein tvp15 [Anaeramoeba ignava]|uniref:Golgi apparatus membrane protein tvp15 n=1 Tax=Anaeramoeba ignava TaxID=1746090 RepID=A0A9Q0LIR9_ANAIG|nr:golgi apparatus membrane protein tvp15 [Anaeramoeba ignava]
MALLLRVFNIILALIMICAEFEMAFVLKNIRFLIQWFGRGIYELFVGLLTLAACTSTFTYDKTIDEIRKAAGYCGIGVGGLYILFVIFLF